MVAHPGRGRWISLRPSRATHLVQTNTVRPCLKKIGEISLSNLCWERQTANTATGLVFSRNISSLVWIYYMFRSQLFFCVFKKKKQTTTLIFNSWRITIIRGPIAKISKFLKQFQYKAKLCFPPSLNN